MAKTRKIDSPSTRKSIGVFSKEEAKARGIQIRLRTRDGGGVDPLNASFDDPSSAGVFPKAREAAKKAIVRLERLIESRDPKVALLASAELWNGLRAIAQLESAAMQLNTFSVQMAVDPSGNFDRSGIGSDIPLDIGVSAADRESLKRFAK
ncbi:MAG: hypothetical protein WCR74_13900 [Betaproteobacteria bacterium]